MFLYSQSYFVIATDAMETNIQTFFQSFKLILLSFPHTSNQTCCCWDVSTKLDNNTLAKISLHVSVVCQLSVSDGCQVMMSYNLFCLNLIIISTYISEKIALLPAYQQYINNRGIATHTQYFQTKALQSKGQLYIMV